MRVDGGFQVADGFDGGGWRWRGGAVARRRGRAGHQWLGLPGGGEGVEGQAVDRLARFVPAIDGPFHHIAQFADIAGPAIGFELRGADGGEAGPLRPVEFGGHAPPEMVGQHRNIAFPRAQGGQGDDFETQPIEQVGAKAPGIGGGGQVVIGRRHDPHVHPQRFRRADPGHFAIFDHAQQPFLRRHRKRTQFVQKQRAAIGFLEPARPGAVRASERALFMAEQFGFYEGFGQGGAVHDDQRFAPARGEVMKALGNQFLAGPALADHQHRAVEFGRAARQFDRVEKGEGLADKLGIFLHVPTYGEISHLLARNILARAWKRAEKWRKSALFRNWHGPCTATGNPHRHKRNVTKAKVQGVISWKRTTTAFAKSAS